MHNKAGAALLYIHIDNLSAHTQVYIPTHQTAAHISYTQG